MPIFSKIVARIDPKVTNSCSQTSQLCSELRVLEPGCYLVLHALQGYGKSTLASATLRDKDLMEELFQVKKGFSQVERRTAISFNFFHSQNEIYWIKFAQRQTLAENILIQLNLLFHQVKNLDLLAEPTSEESLKYSLRKHFSEHNHALLVLDDVNSKEIIDAFDFGCKTLVLTTDMDVLKGRKKKVIKVGRGIEKFFSSILPTVKGFILICVLFYFLDFSLNSMNFIKSSKIVPPFLLHQLTNLLLIPDDRRIQPERVPHLVFKRHRNPGDGASATGARNTPRVQRHAVDDLHVLRPVRRHQGEPRPQRNY